MHRRTLLTAAAAAGLAAPPVLAQALTPLRFGLDWVLQGNHAMWSLADDRGLFRQAGLTVRMDRGYGSGDTLLKVAAGAVELGFADVSGAVKFNAENPDKRLVCIYLVFDRTAAAAVTLRRSGITKPTDLAGKRLTAPDAEASRLLFPAFARAAGIDASTIQWSATAANLRDTMLVTNRADAVTGFLFTVHFNLLGLNIPEADIVSFPYAEHGLDIYGSGVFARADWLERNAEAAAGFVRASVGGLQALLADVPAGMASLKRRETLFDEALEARRFAMTRDRSILTPNARANGLGTLDAARSANLVRVNAEAYGIANPPAPDSMFTDRYLPPLSERRG